jgi:chloride channel protein, CIC family
VESEPSILRDFTVDSRVWLLSGIALIIGVGATFLAVLLLRLIALSTNLFYYHRFSLLSVSPSGSSLGYWMVFVPALGGFIVGLMARFGSDKIRGHGIPEAIEAILLHRAQINPKIAILKPISAAIAIGSGGPFGAEGPIIMTGGAFGSLVAQWIHLTDVERTTLLVSGAAAGMSATFATPVAAILLAIELLLFELRPRSLVPVREVSQLQPN